MELQQRIKLFLGTYQTAGWIVVLMAAGALVQLLLYMAFYIAKAPALYETVLTYLTLPGKSSQVLFQPWSLVTYPFFYNYFSPFSFLIDGWILFMFTRIHQQFLGDERTRRLILLSVPVVGLVSILLALFLPLQPIDPRWCIYGVNPLLITIVASTITLVPHFPIQLLLFGRVKLMWVGLVIIAIELLGSMMTTPQTVAVVVAGLAGFGFIRLMKSGTDVTEVIWEYYQDKKEDEPAEKIRVAYKAPARSEPDAKTGDVSQETIDQILDKISENGYESLSRREKEILYQASKGDSEDS